MTFFYDGQSIAVVIKWLDYVYEVLPTRKLTLFVRGDNVLEFNGYFRLRLTGFDSVEVWQQIRQWSHYDEIVHVSEFIIFNEDRKSPLADPPISLDVNREVLKKVALLLSLRCDVLSTLARRLLTK